MLRASATTWKKPGRPRICMQCKTSLFWTPLGQGNVSSLERCPYFRGGFVHKSILLGPQKLSSLERCPYISEVSRFHCINIFLWCRKRSAVVLSFLSAYSATQRSLECSMKNQVRELGKYFQKASGEVLKECQAYSARQREGMYLHVCMYVFVCVYIYMCVYLCVSMHMCLCVYVCVCVCVFVYKCLCMCVCM